MTKFDRIAERLAGTWDERPDYKALTGDLALDSIAEAYEAQVVVQQAYAAKRGAIVGRKIALAAKAMQEFVGIDHPVGGAIFAGDLHDSPAEIKLADFNHLGLEFELALTLGEDISPATDHTPDSLKPRISAARPAYELIEDRSADYSNLDVKTMIADNAWCGGVVLGPEIAGWQDMDLAALPARLIRPGHEDMEGSTAATDPLGSLTWVLNDLGARGITVKRGEIVITGSMLTTQFPKKCDGYRFEICGAAVEMSVI